MSRETRATEVFEIVESDPSRIQVASNVPGMPQFNSTRDKANATAIGLSTEATQRQQADDANTANDVLNAQADATETARAQAADALNLQTDAAEVVRAKAAEGTNASNIANNAAADVLEATARTQGDATNKNLIDSNTSNDTARATAQSQKDTAQDTAQSGTATALVTETTRAKTAEDLNTANDTTRAAAQKTKDDGQDTKNLEQDNSLAGIVARLVVLESKMGKLGIQAEAAGTIATPAITLLAAQDVTVPFSAGTMPDANYAAFAFIEGTAVGKLSAVVKTKTTTGCVVTITPTALLTVGAGAVTVIAWKVVA